MNKSLEALYKIVEKYDWLGKEYCRLIGKGDELHKFNQTVFVECLVTPIKQDLERLELIEKLYDKTLEDMKTLKDDDRKLYLKYKELEKENQELKDKVKEMLHYLEEAIEVAKKYENAIKILKEKPFVLEFGLSVFKWYEEEKIYYYYHEYTEYYGEDLEYKAVEYILTQQEYELLKEVLENE